MSRYIYQRALKRGADLAGALIAIVLLAPLLIFVCLLVRARIGRPVLFRQARPGLAQRTFTLLKFRTMSDERDPSGHLLPDDQRLGGFGLALRATSLDELPSLLNIIRGDMSFVGPRPLLPEYLPLYNVRQAMRHSVRPGLTGWAQVNGRNQVAWKERLELDAWYVENVSFRLDLRILSRTFSRVIRRQGVSANGEATMTPFTGCPTE